MYDSTSINSSVTYIGKAGEDFIDAVFRIVKFDGNGNLVLAQSGDVPVGVIPAGVPDTVKAGQKLTIQVKDIALCEAVGAIAAGSFVTCGDGGTCIAAVSGSPVLGQALNSRDSGGVLSIQITKGAKA